MIRTLRILATASLLLSAGCGDVALSTSPSGDAIPLVRLRSEPFSYTYNSGFDAPARLVIRDVAHWGTIWARIHARSLPLPPVPTVDFSREMLIVVAQGSQPNGGFTILIDDASEVGIDGMSVTVRRIAPGSRCFVTGAFTSPVDIARSPRREGEVRFVETVQVRDCD